MDGMVAHFIRPNETYLSCRSSTKPWLNPPTVIPIRHHNTAAAEQTHGDHAGTINAAEAAKFAKLADQWWDPAGPFKTLHELNPIRCKFIRNALCDHFELTPNVVRPLEGLRLLDVGCGGGILSESLTRLGAQVTGIDVNQAGIDTASKHAESDPDLASQLTFRLAPIEQLAAEGLQFDAVIASEVIEHVDNVPGFCEALGKVTKPGGAALISTINRTPQAYALAVAAAEYILKIVPVKTHDWDRFITPAELALLMRTKAGLDIDQLAGMVYDPIRGVWELSRSTAVNYIAYFRKQS